MDNIESKISDNAAISLREIVLKFDEWINYLFLKRRIIFMFCVVFGSIGFFYSFFKKPIYTAESTFVLEESDISSGFGQISGIASIMGLSIDNSAGGLFKGDNIIELYKSRKMIEKALLSVNKSGGKNVRVIDRFLDCYGIRKSWKDNPKLKSFQFSERKFGNDIVQDSIMAGIVNFISRENLDVSKPDKKLSIISVKVRSIDEIFSKIFSEQLVKTVNSFYVETRTKKAYENLLILQKQTDSIKYALNTAINKVASTNQSYPNANPLLLSLKVPGQIVQVDAQANAAIYSEIAKNLELARVTLRKETPLIQNIDIPILPLPKKVFSPILYSFVGFVIGLLISSVILIMKKTYIEIKADK